MRKTLQSSTCKLEIYTGTKENIPAGPLCIWSPKNGGTIHIDATHFMNIKWFDRLVMLKLSLAVHRFVEDGRLVVKDKAIVWDKTNYLPTYDKAMAMVGRGLPQSAMLAIRDLPWFADTAPVHRNTASRSHHVAVLHQSFVPRST
jgi:hypothetical protein